MLTNFRDEFGSMDRVAMVRYLADQVVGAFGIPEVLLPELLRPVS